MMCHLHILVEEESMEAFLKVFISRHWPGAKGCWSVNAFKSKDELLRRLPERLRNFRNLVQQGSARILVLIDRDSDDCRDLAEKLEEMARVAGLVSIRRKSEQIANCVVIEELESWFFGDIPALCDAYSGVPASLADQRGFRDPDAITGGVWEKLLKILQESGHFRGAKRLPKTKVAECMARKLTPDRNRSASFQYFWRTLSTMMPAPPEES